MHSKIAIHRRCSYREEQTGSAFLCNTTKHFCDIPKVKYECIDFGYFLFRNTRHQIGKCICQYNSNSMIQTAQMLIPRMFPLKPNYAI